MNNQTCELSIVVTIFNDATMIDTLVQKLISELSTVVDLYEIILVNDGSRDDSTKEIKNLSEKYPFVRGVILSRNFGQQIAVTAGLQYAKGDFVIAMDSDMHTTVTTIPLLLTKIKEGYDIVYTVSKVRDSWITTLASRFFWFLVTKIFRVRMVPHQLMLRIMTAEFVRFFSMYEERNRTVAGISSDITLKHAVLEIQNSKRSYGLSNYKFVTRFNIFVDLIFSLTMAPLNFLIYFGTTILFLTVTMSCYYLYTYLTTSILPGFTSLLLSIFFFGGSTIVILGILGRYLATILIEVKRRPLFLVQEKYNLD